MTATLAPLRAWIPGARPARARVRLFCLPCAGGSAAMYRGWAEHLPPEVDLCAVQLPGRGARIEEPPFTAAQPLARVLADALEPLLDIPYAIFGHSMGALVGFELARHLRNAGAPAPVRLFASAFRAPHLADADPSTHHLPDDALVASLRRMEGTPGAILDHPESMHLFLPTVRADVALCETYVHADEEPLGCPITAFGGFQDRIVTTGEVEAWSGHTAVSFERFLFPGGHFFLNRHARAMLRIVGRHLAAVPAA